MILARLLALFELLKLNASIFGFTNKSADTVSSNDNLPKGYKKHTPSSVYKLA